MTSGGDIPPRAADGAPLPTAPATGAIEPYFTELEPGEEPMVTGTLFLTIVILIIIAAFWIVIYTQLLGR